MAGETILIIDDNVDVRTLLGERVLPSYGYRTMMAPDGQEGLWQIRTHKPDLILLDLRLPDMTGLDLLHILSSEGYDTPVILITAYGSELIAAQALRLGVHDYIIKPFTLDEIVESVERALTEQRLRHERNALTVRLHYCTGALRTLADAATAVAGPEDLHLRLCRMLELAVAATQGSAGRLWLVEPAAGDLDLQVVQDRVDQRAYVLHGGEQISTQVEQALVSGELQEWPREGPEEKGTAMALQILRAGRPAGVLEMHLPAEASCHGDPCALILRAFADLIGATLEWFEVQRQTTLLQRQVEVLGQFSHDLVLVLDESDAIVGVNPAITTMTGQSPDQVVGQNLGEWARGIESPPGELLEWYAQQTGPEPAAERYVISFQGAQGEPHQAEVQSLLEQERDGPPRRYLLFHEVTAYNRLEQQVRSLRQALAGQTRGSQVGLLLTDLKGTVLAVNSALCGLLELTPAALLGKPLWEALGSLEGCHLLPEEIARACRQGSSYAQIQWPDRMTDPLGIASLLLLGPEGSPHAIAVLVAPAPLPAAGLDLGRPGDEGDLLGSPGLDPSPRA